MGIVNSTIGAITYSVISNGTSIYLYYDMALLVCLIASAIWARKYASAMLKGVGRETMLALFAIVLAFLIVEALFVSPTLQMYEDEYIHMGIAKEILLDHVGGICSLSSQTHCLAGTAGFFQQPIGWALLMAIAFGIFGIGFSTAFNLALALSALSVALVFYISYAMLKDRKVSLLATLSFAATPLFMTYARSTVLDIPSLTMSLLAISTMLTYFKYDNIRTRVATIFSFGFALVMKVDAIILVPIAAAFLLSYKYDFRRGVLKGSIGNLAVLCAALFAIVLPQLLFIYTTYTTNTFGQAIGGPRFSTAFFMQNIVENVKFWFDFYGNATLPSLGYYWHSEYPAVYTVLAIVGLAAMARKGMGRQATLLAAWFSIVLIFYTSYYAGGVLYGLGSDVRYFMLDFPVVSILMAAGAIYVYRAAIGVAAVKVRGVRRAVSRRHHARLIATLALVLLMAEPTWQFFSIVTLPPLQQAAFAAERASMYFFMAHDSVIPHSCMVITFEPHLWWMLNYSNIFASWILMPKYWAAAQNISGGCYYFARTIDCSLSYINNTGYQNPSVTCQQLFSNFTMVPVYVENYTKFGWNDTIGIYRVTGHTSAFDRVIANSS